MLQVNEINFPNVMETLKDESHSNYFPVLLIKLPDKAANPPTIAPINPVTSISN